jgi:hypothetical protein
MNFKHHLWPQTGESAIPSDWQVYTDTLRYLRRNFPAGTNGNKPIYFFLSIGCSKLWKSLHMPTLTCQAFVSIILTHAYYTCFIHVSPTLPLSLTFQASSMMMRFFTLQSQTIQTHQHILYIYILFFFETGADLTWHVDVNSHQYFLQISKNQFWSSKIVYVRIQRFVIMFHINIAILGEYCIRHIQISSTAWTSNFQTTSTLWYTNIAMDNHHL